MPARPRGVLFDLGGTLLEERAVDLEAGTERLLAIAGNPRGLTARQLRRELDELDADLQRRRDASWLEIPPFAAQRLVYEPNGIAFDRPPEEVELEFWRGASRFALQPGIVEALSRLRAAGLALAVVSNSRFTSRTLEWQLEECGLLPFFRFVMSSADYGVRKPHPRIFRVACARLGVSPGDAWFAGDSLAYDVAGARSAGLVSVWYDPEPVPRGRAGSDREIGPDFEIGRWSELPELVEGGAGGSDAAAPPRARSPDREPQPDLRVTDEPAQADVRFLEEQLNEFNYETTGYRDGRPLAVFARDAEGGIRAGLAGHTWGGCCEVRFLWVRARERRRGLGGRLLEAAEREAAARGCGRIALSTHSFQAPEFYRRRGYRVAGEVEDHPRGHGSLHLWKPLARAGARPRH